MKIGNIVQPNSKGQIVIPKKIREELAITKNTHLNLIVSDKGIYIYPIDRIETNPEPNKEVFLEFLKKNRGRWGAASAEELEKEKKQRELDLKAAAEAKNAW